jgi:hypothetical protein
LTLLSLCQDAADEIGIPQPASIISNTDPSVLQLLRAANRTGKKLVTRYPWEGLTKEGSFTSLAAESQGVLTTIATDFNRFKNDTMYDRTSKWKIFGPITDTQWQRLNASTASGVRYWFRIRGGKIIIWPTMTAGNSVYFEYISEDWVDSGTGATPAVADAAVFDNDLNTVVFPEETMTLGVIWRFLKGKGLPYLEQQAEYEQQVKDDIMQDGAKGIINMTGGVYEGWPANTPENGFG